MFSLVQRINALSIKAQIYTNVLAEAVISRGASKKAGGSTKNHGNARRKRRGIRVQDGRFVQKGTILVLQRYLIFHPGLNVGFGRNGTLFAMVPGTVRVTCEKPDLNMDHSWVRQTYGGRSVENMYKKYFNVLPEKQHQRFKLLDKI
ncbi:50S ribosomal protein L27-like isoform X1 [Homalodisca vitripennis]|uniref:50S ribosomal protein L27-like isoform X1 n=1 Tax=Homalodisca vitripennis TaxID=197043 RepID=UPI001EEA3A7B|nr:50S ribosomal protein L27-like isoform X1 [Homalodisca vitripennis]KAG8258969.1 60S ribosomal protein L27, mitochondrial [Homalodisca vitripennis]